MFDRRLLTHFNWPLLGIVMTLALMGLVNLKSATSSFDSISQAQFFHAQIVWSLIGLGLLSVIISIHYRHFRHLSYFIYILSLLLLILVLLVGRKVSEHQSWLSLGPVSLQPTEFAKLGLIFALSRHLAEIKTPKGAGLVELIPSFVVFVLPTLLVILQGDLGSSLFFGLIYFSLVLIHGIRWKVIALVFVLGVLSSVSAYFFFLSPYQKDRIATFLHPEGDRLGAGYQLIQSKIAVGSGGWTGKGYLHGKTHKLKFVPERHTDFIFPVLAEEWGLWGGMVVLGGFLVFLMTALQVANRSADRFAFFLCAGISALFFWHMVVNLGGVLGLMPLTGVTLPFFSYGGSALLTNWIGVALLLNVSMRRFMF